MCDHPVYSKCTLFEKDGLGLAVIQQRWNYISKISFWTEIDDWLISDIYYHKKFQEYFAKRARKPENGLYPTVTVRQLMWALKMKPLKRERWETCFDRREV